MAKDFDYDIALSFAGKERPIVDAIAKALGKLHVRVFYDNFSEADLWGRDLYQYLQEIYRDRARYCVVFVSAAYADKAWPKHELKQMQARAFRENEEYILPVRVDGTELPGLNETTGYIDLRQKTPEELTDLILQKLYGRIPDIDSGPPSDERVEFRGDLVASFWPDRLKRAQLKRTYAVEIPRIRYGQEERRFRAAICHNCMAEEGEFHDPGCDVEECPLCHGPAAFCGCSRS